MATSSSKKKTGSAKKPAAAPKKQPAKKQPAVAPTPAPTAPTWPYAIVCIVLSLLAFLGLFHAEGVIIDGFAGFLSGIMGWGYWAFPFAMLLLAWVFVRNPERHFGLRVTASLLIAPLFGTIVHLMVCRVPFTAQTFGAIVGQLYDGGKALTSGGVISGGVGYLLKAGISVYAALPLTMAAFVACVLGSMDLTVGKIITWWRAHREAQYIPDDGDQPLFDDEDEPAAPPQPEPQRRARRAAPDKPVAKKKLIDIPVEDTPSDPDDEPIDPIPVKKAARGAKKPAPAEATQNVQPLSVEEAADICGVDVTAAQEIHDPPKPSKKAASAAVAAETAAITSAIERENADHSAYQLPPVSFLRAGKKDQTDATEEIRFNRDRLDTALSSFGVNATIRDVTRGPTVTRYDLELEAGVKLNKITNLSGDLALALGVENVRIAPIPDKISTVGIEVPNKIVSAVCLRDIIDSPAFRNAKSKLSFAVGKDIGGNCIIGNISKLPHMLIAGTTGSGKSVCMNSLILSLLYKATPDEVRLIMIDPKMVELGIYNGIPHLYIPVVTDPKKAAGSLQWAVVEMMKRYRLFSEIGVRDLKGYNTYKTRLGEPTIPSVVIVIDELADLMMTAAKEVEESICRVAQMGRAAGMHLIIATQRPSADVITGLMKANIPSRIAFAVSSSLESRIILDTSGAEKLIGMGDMLYAPIGTGKPLRVQGSFVSDEEREEVVRFIKQNSEAQYSDDIIAQIEKSAADADKKSGPAPEADKSAKSDYDELLPQAVDVILETKQASVSMLQRRLKLGYSRAARMVDQMEEMGIVGPFEGSKPRKILITKEQWQEMQYVQGTAPSEVLQAQTEFADVNEEEPEDDES